MNKVEFYEDRNGVSELNNQLMDLARRSLSSKDARVQFKQITYCVERLKEQGARLPESISKHLQGEVWELRPGNNRVLYFFFEGNTYVLLHMFQKKTQKTPRSEIEKAEREIADYKLRKGSM